MNGCLDIVPITFNKKNNFMVCFKTSINKSFLINKELKLNSKIDFLSNQSKLDEKKIENLKCLLYQGDDLIIDLFDELTKGEYFLITDKTYIKLETNSLNDLENYEIILYLEHSDENPDMINDSEKISIKKFLDENLAQEDPDDEEDFSEIESVEESENSAYEEEEDLLEEAEELNKDNEWEQDLEQVLNDNNEETKKKYIEDNNEMSSQATNNIMIKNDNFLEVEKKYLLRRKRKSEYHGDNLNFN
jgi:hypothetical protein